jgi:hypothetical protein
MRYRLTELLPRTGDRPTRNGRKRKPPTAEDRVHDLVRQITETGARLDASLDEVWEDGVRLFRPETY